MTREACVFYAHSTDQADKSDWQLLRHHLLSVAALSAERGAKFGASGAAALAGLLHDLGKYNGRLSAPTGGRGECRSCHRWRV